MSEKRYIFPASQLSILRRYPGNDKCMDCGNFDTDWADVSHGILLCIECSGKHRALGMYIYRNR